MTCAPRTRDTQPFPQTGLLASNMDVFPDILYARITDNHATVYSYVVATVKNRGGQFAQTGSAPNFQGGMITLRTCKHLMRTFLTHDDWKGVWIAGFTGVRAGQGGNALVYLMQTARICGN